MRLSKDSHCTGFTLVEVLIGMGMVAGLSLALGEVTRNSARAQRNVVGSSDFENLNSAIRLLFTTPSLCKSNLPVCILTGLAHSISLRLYRITWRV